MSLRARLLLTYLSLILIGFGGLALFAGRQIESSAIEDYENNLVVQTGLIARALHEPVEEFREGELRQDAVSGRLEAYATELDARLLLLDTNGRAWLASDGPAFSIDQRERPEVAAALDGRTTYDTRAEGGTTMIYTAAPVLEDGRVISVLQIVAPLQSARRLVVQRWLTLGGGVLALALLGVLASLWLSASLTRPLARLRDAALQVAGGDLEARVPVGNDEMGEVAAAFNHMAGQVQAMLEEQRAFASNASHELRTPLTTVRLRSEALREGALDEETTGQYIAEIDDEVRRLSGLVQDLILLSRLDSGRARPGQEQIDVVRMLRSLLAEMSPEAEAKGIKVTVQAPPDLPAVCAGLNHLRVVFRNLLDNALKYTPAGGEVRCRLAVDGDSLHVTVADTGRGIAAADLPHVFERFYRADKARSREIQGVGLGLSLVRAVVQAYGGRIEVQSPGPDQGTTVELWWPLGLPEPGI